MSISLILAYVLTKYYGFEGLVSRGSVRDGVINFNYSKSAFFMTQLDYFLIALSSVFLQKWLKTSKNLLLFFSTVISIYLLVRTGTRWYWLLSVSPMLVYVLLNLKFMSKIIVTLIFGFCLVWLGGNRNDVEVQSVQDTLTWDLPSYQSEKIVKNLDSDISGFLDFYNGQIIVLIPRFIWPSKPLDVKTTAYMEDEIGEAFGLGGTILPGFIGSAWLYGGFFGIIFFGAIYFNLLRATERLILKNINGEKMIYLGSLYIGLILQLRGISIFYLIPAFYAYLIYKFTNIISRLKQNY